MMDNEPIKVILLADETKNNFLSFFNHIGEVEAIFISAIIAAVIGYFTIKSQWKITKKQTTLNFLSQLNMDESYRKYWDDFLRISKESIDFSQLGEKELDSTPDVISLRTILNHFEIIAISCNHDILDYDYVSSYIKENALLCWKYCSPYIKKLRLRDDNPLLYYEFEWLVRSYSMPGFRRRNPISLRQHHDPYGRII